MAFYVCIWSRTGKYVNGDGYLKNSEKLLRFWEKTPENLMTDIADAMAEMRNDFIEPDSILVNSKILDVLIDGAEAHAKLKTFLGLPVIVSDNLPDDKVFLVTPKSNNPLGPLGFALKSSDKNGMVIVQTNGIVGGWGNIVQFTSKIPKNAGDIVFLEDVVTNEKL